MKQNKINFVKLLKGYRDGWVAISHDFKRVVFHGRNLKDVMKKAKGSKGKVYYFPAGEAYSSFVG